jgi:putative ABC transport system permease protein
MFKDFRHAYRTLRKHPGFSLTAIVSIALAIGANSAIFSLQDALLLRPLAVTNPSTLVTVNSRTPSGAFAGFPYPDVVDLREKNRSFDGLVAYRLIGAGVAQDVHAQPQFRAGLLVTGNFFDLLGVKIRKGRGFRPDEDSVAGRDAVVVLSHDFWENDLGSDPSIVGRSIRMGRSADIDFTVIGIAPESFTGMDQFIRPAFYIPVMMAPKLLGETEAGLTVRSTRTREDSFYVKARLKPGVGIAAGESDAESIAKTLAQAYPQTNQGRGAAVRTEMQSRLDATPVLGGVIAAVGAVSILILLIACANVMNLMLSRGRSRTREIAIRLSIGASRARLIRQLMAECAIIAVTGGALGLMIAEGAVQYFSAWELPGDAPIKLAFQLDARVLFFTLAVSMASAILFGLLPALRATGPDLATALKAGESAGSRKRFGVRNTLAAIQITGSIVLVMAAVQMYINTSKAVLANPGFVMQHRLTVRLDPSVAGYSPTQIEQFYRSLVDRVGASSGIRSAAIASSVPFTTDGLVAAVAPEGFEFPAGMTAATVRGDAVGEHFFETLGIPLIAGRGFLPSDQANSPKVAVVNEAFAQRLLAGNPLGKRVRLRLEDEEWVEVVGVSGTAKYQSIVEPPIPGIYVPYSQQLRSRMTLIVEGTGDAASLAPQVRNIIRSMDSRIPIFSVRTLEEIFERNGVMLIRTFVVVFGATAAMGFFLALVGLYAVISYQVARRTREIGIRMALGAERMQVLRMILQQTGRIAGIAIAAGLVLSVLVRPALLVSLGRQATGGPLAGFDPALFLGLPLLLLVITMMAAAIPARRASKIDPQQTLRQE